MRQITKEELASLKTVAKASAARASEALSKLIGIPVKLQMMQTRMVEVKHLIELLVFPEKSVSAVFLPVMTGESKGSSALISSPQESLRLAELIMKRPKGFLTQLDDPAISALKETANIIGGAFLSVLSDTAGVSFIQSVPSHAIDTINKVVDMAIAELGHKDSELWVALEIDFALSTTTIEEIMTNYIFLLEVASAQKLLEVLEK
ncbi:chemotaxis protein CheC [Candidatus Falkowbacteria bacterium]|nr:chemotaxis protein CheC [Candidatus Falkowbacteria bacterium]